MQTAGDRTLASLRGRTAARPLALLGCALATLIGVALPPARLAAQEGRKIALVIAISDYGDPPAHPKTGQPLRPYRDLNAKNDVPLVRGALLRQGFAPEHIRLLQDAEADAEGIRAAFRDLARDVRPGDVVVLHYSGHGHRITNDDPAGDEEVDGYDEVLVPHGAPDEFYEGYDGALHIRDDELGLLLTTLRERAGPSGNVTFFLDACYSGTATRGDDELIARGSVEPLGAPNPPDAATAPEGDGTGIEAESSVTTRGNGDGLAPFAVFSAASQRQVAYETWDVDGRTRVGSLSYAIARTLPEAAPGTSYRALFAQVARALSGKVRQTPQVEGTLDAMLFSDRLVPQQPYVEVGRVSEDGRFAVLAGGSLLGLNEGTRLLVHEAGATHPEPESALATLVVRESQPLEAVAEITEGALTGEAGRWAFVVSRSYGDLRTRVRLAPGLPERDVQGLTRVFQDLGILELVQEGADVVVEPAQPMLVARTVQDAIPLGRGPAEVAQRVEEYARNQYLRRLSFTDEEIRVALELSPVEIERDLLGRPRGCGPPDWASEAHPGKSLGGGQWRLALGDAYRLRVRNTGERRAFVAVLDLLPDGPIKVLRPRDGESPASYELEPGIELDLGCYQLTDHTGHETLKLFATETPQDFRSLFESRGTRGPGGGDLSELERLVGSTYASTRSGEVGAPRGLATTVALQIHVTERRR